MNFQANSIYNFQQIIEKGGIMMIPLGICSFLLVLITFEKVFALRKNRVVSKKDFESWKLWFGNGLPRENLPKCLFNSIINSLIITIVPLIPSTESYIKERVSDITRKEKHKLERGLIILEIIAGIAPMFGLLGTALGMVDVFAHLSVPSGEKMEFLSSGISQALFTTIAGLFIGIPSLIVFNLFTRQIGNLLMIVEDQVNSIFDTNYNQIFKESNISS